MNDRNRFDAPAAPLTILVGADVSPDPNAGASGTVWQMNEALRRRGHHVDEIWAEDLGRRIKHGNLHYLSELPRAYRREVRKACARQSYDVIELNQPHAYAAARDHRASHRSGVFINRSHGHEVRSEETLGQWRVRLNDQRKAGVRGLASQLLRRLLDRQWEQIARYSDGFVVSCSEDADFLNARYSVDRQQIGMVTQGVPDNFLIRPCQSLTKERLDRVLYVGQLAFFKAPMMLGEAVTQILRSRPDAVMSWVCGAEHHQDARRLLGADIAPRVQFLDWMPQEQLIDTYDRHGVFLFPSFFEGFGKTPLEAMSRGLCVVASSTGGMRDFVDDGVSGRLVPIGQPDLMADVALQLMADSKLAQKLSTSARQTAERHTWDRCAADAVTFYQQVLDLKRQQKLA